MAKIRLFLFGYSPIPALLSPQSPPSLPRLMLIGEITTSRDRHPSPFSANIGLTFKVGCFPLLFWKSEDSPLFNPTTLARFSSQLKSPEYLNLPGTLLLPASNHEARVVGSGCLVGRFGRQCQRMSFMSVYSPLNTSDIGPQQDLAYSPPYYPSPWTTGAGDWADAYKRAVEFVSGLSLDEKVNLTTGSG